MVEGRRGLDGNARHLSGRSFREHDTFEQPRRGVLYRRTRTCAFQARTTALISDRAEWAPSAPASAPKRPGERDCWRSCCSAGTHPLPEVSEAAAVDTRCAGNHDSAYALSEGWRVEPKQVGRVTPCA